MADKYTQTNLLKTQNEILEEIKENQEAGEVKETNKLLRKIAKTQEQILYTLQEIGGIFH